VAELESGYRSVEARVASGAVPAAEVQSELERLQTQLSAAKDADFLLVSWIERVVALQAKAHNLEKHVLLGVVLESEAKPELDRLYSDWADAKENENAMIDSISHPDDEPVEENYDSSTPVSGVASRSSSIMQGAWAGEFTDDTLPSGWERVWSEEEHGYYFVNEDAQVSQWEHPSAGAEECFSQNESDSNAESESDDDDESLLLLHVGMTAEDIASHAHPADTLLKGLTRRQVALIRDEEMIEEYLRINGDTPEAYEELERVQTDLAHAKKSEGTLKETHERATKLEVSAAECDLQVSTLTSEMEQEEASVKEGKLRLHEASGRAEALKKGLDEKQETMARLRDTLRLKKGNVKQHELEVAMAGIAEMQSNFDDQKIEVQICTTFLDDALKQQQARVKAIEVAIAMKAVVAADHKAAIAERESCVAALLATEQQRAESSGRPSRRRMSDIPLIQPNVPPPEKRARVRTKSGMEEDEKTPVPEGWQRGWSKEHQRYYFVNELNSASQWEVPSGDQEDATYKHIRESNRRAVLENMVANAKQAMNDPEQDEADGTGSAVSKLFPRMNVDANSTNPYLSSSPISKFYASEPQAVSEDLLHAAISAVASGASNSKFKSITETRYESAAAKSDISSVNVSEDTCDGSDGGSPSAKPRSRTSYVTIQEKRQRSLYLLEKELENAQISEAQAAAELKAADAAGMIVDGYVVDAINSKMNSIQKSLPAGWTVSFDPSFKACYYVNDYTQDTQWNSPTEGTSKEDYVVNVVDAKEGEEEQLRSAIRSANGQHGVSLDGEVLVPGNVAAEESAEFINLSEQEKEISKNLPAGWSVTYSFEVKSFYFVNDVNGSSQWERPHQSAMAEAIATAKVIEGLKAEDEAKWAKEHIHSKKLADLVRKHGIAKDGETALQKIVRLAKLEKEMQEHEHVDDDSDDSDEADAVNPMLRSKRKPIGTASTAATPGAVGALDPTTMPAHSEPFIGGKPLRIVRVTPRPPPGRPLPQSVRVARAAKPPPGPPPKANLNGIVTARAPPPRGALPIKPVRLTNMPMSPPPRGASRARLPPPPRLPAAAHTGSLGEVLRLTQPPVRPRLPPPARRLSLSKETGKNTAVRKSAEESSFFTTPEAFGKHTKSRRGSQESSTASTPPQLETSESARNSYFTNPVMLPTKRASQKLTLTQTLIAPADSSRPTVDSQLRKPTSRPTIGQLMALERKPQKVAFGSSAARAHHKVAKNHTIPDKVVQIHASNNVAIDGKPIALIISAISGPGSQPRSTGSSANTSAANSGLASPAPELAKAAAIAIKRPVGPPPPAKLTAPAAQHTSHNKFPADSEFSSKPPCGPEPSGWQKPPLKPIVPEAEYQKSLARPNFELEKRDEWAELSPSERHARELAARAALLTAPDHKTVRLDYKDPAQRSTDAWKAANPDHKKGELWLGPAAAGRLSVRLEETDD